MPDIIKIYFPEHLKADIKKLRTELSMQFLQRDLLLEEGKNIETAYLLRFGALEYKAYEAQCNYYRAKRRLAIIIAKRNRQEKIDLSEIERELDEEFEAYKRTLEEKLRDINKAIDRSKMDVLSEVETKELKKLYRTIVKLLHPDLNPDQTQVDKDLFIRAVEAFQDGDLKTLRIIYDILEGKALEDDLDKVSDNEALVQEKARLEKLLAELNEEIKKIKETFPFTLKVYLDDDKKATEREKDLTDLLNVYREGIAQYEKEIEKYLKSR